MRIKLTIIAIIAAMFIAPYSFADNAKTTTSQGYVDTQIATKQDKVPAVDTNTVITTTNTTGEIAQKQIYDASGNYLDQQSALVSAKDANDAIQKAIDTEFVCVDWINDDPVGGCLIWSIRQVVSQQILPTGYTPVEYIQGNGSGTINTGLVFDSGTLKYSLEIYTESLVDYTGLGEKDVIGNFTGSDTSRGFVAGVYCGPYNNEPRCTIDNAYFFNYVSPKNLHHSSSTNKWHTLETEFANNTMTVTLDGNSNSIARTSYHNSSPVVLMGGSESYRLASNMVKIRNIKIWHNDQLVRNYVTCRDSNNVYGVYDLVNNTFTGTTNGTVLTGGPDINIYMPTGN